MDLDRNIGKAHGYERAHLERFGTGEPYVIFGSREPIEVKSAQDLIDNNIPESTQTILTRFGREGVNTYLDGMARRGLMGLVEIANAPRPREHVLQEGVGQIPGQI